MPTAPKRLTRNELKGIFPHASDAFLDEAACDVVEPAPIGPAPKRKPSHVAESHLQQDCEKWLRARGYMPMSAASAEIEAANSLRVGWYGHLHEAEFNPLCADLMIYNAAMNRCLHVELKVRSQYQPGQREMIALGCWKECWTFQHFAELVDQFEKENAKS